MTRSIPNTFEHPTNTRRCNSDDSNNGSRGHPQDFRKIEEFKRGLLSLPDNFTKLLMEYFTSENNVESPDNQMGASNDVRTCDDVMTTDNHDVTSDGIAVTTNEAEESNDRNTSSSAAATSTSEVLPSLDLDLKAQLKNLEDSKRNFSTSDDMASYIDDVTTRPESHDITATNYLTPVNDLHLLDQHRQRLQTVQLPDYFLTSATVEASRTMMPRQTPNPDDVICLAAKLSTSQHGGFPNAKMLVDLLIDCDFDEETIIRRYMNLPNNDITEVEGSIAEEHLDNPQGATSSTASSAETHEHETADEHDVPTPVSTVVQSVQPPPPQSNNLPNIPSTVFSDTSTTVEPTVSENSTMISQTTSSEQTTTPAQSTVSTSVQPNDSTTSPATSSSSSVPARTSPRSPPTEAERMSRLCTVVTREHEIWLQTSRCVSCKTSPREMTFLPCGHLSLCAQCASQTSTCPVCLGRALAEVRTFLV